MKEYKKDQYNRIQSPETYPCRYNQLIFHKGAKEIQWKGTVFSTNTAEKTGQPHTIKKKLI